MATRSQIGILNNEDDNSVTAVYCHSDGYLQHNGKILLEHYTDEDKIRDLIENGNMSSLGKTVEECEFYSDWGEGMEVYDYPSTKEFLEEGQEFNYLFNPVTKQWFWSFRREMKMKRLHPEDCNSRR